MPEIRQNIFNSRVKHLQELGKTQSNMGHDILSDLWDIYKQNLWATEEYAYITEENEMIVERFERFGEFCEKAIRPFYEPPEYFDKFVFVVDRVFRYVHVRHQQDEPIIIPFTGEPLTVEMLIEAPKWISKLIIISNKMEACDNDEQIEALFFAGFDGDVADVREVGDEISNSRVTIRIPYIERPLPQSHYNLFFEDIDEEQYSLIKKKMGRILDRHFD